MLFAGALVPPAHSIRASNDPDAIAGAMCKDVKDIPSVKEMRTQVMKVEHAAGDARRVAAEYAAACDEMARNPQGDGQRKFAEVQPRMSSARGTLQQENQTFSVQAAKIGPAMQALGHGSCVQALQQERQRIAQQFADVSTTVTRACNAGTAEARALQAAAHMTSGDEYSVNRDMSKVQEALLNPGANSAYSKELNDEANSFGQQHGLNAGRPPCGEKCASILAYKAAIDTYGPGSPQATRALAAAQATQLGRFGRSSLTTR